MGKHISLETWIKWLWHYAYFQQGLNTLNQAKYLILLMGLWEAVRTSSVKFTAIVSVVYGVTAYFVGWLCYHSDFMRANAEIGNKINPLAAEIREHLSKNGTKTQPLN